MIEPLLWNPLPAAAAWLTERTSRAFDARSLINAVASLGKEGDPTPTKIKAVLPPEMSFATLAMPGHPMFSDTTKIPATSAWGSAECGPLPGGMAYLGPAYPRLEPLPVNSLLDLLVYGTTTIAILTERWNENQHERVWVMPWGTSHRATVETCGINRADLLALGEALTANTPPQAAPEPAPVVLPAWSVKKPTRYGGYTAPLHALLTAAYRDSKPCPTARDVVEAWRIRKPPEIDKVLPDGFDYYDSTGDTKPAGLGAIREAIKRMVSAR